MNFSHKQREPEPKEPVVAAKDQVKFRQQKPKPAAELPPMGRVEIEKEKAAIKEPQQGPEIPKEEIIPAKDQVQIKKQYKPKPKEAHEGMKLEEKSLKQTPPVVKQYVLFISFYILYVLVCMLLSIYGHIWNAIYQPDCYSEIWRSQMHLLKRGLRFFTDYLRVLYFSLKDFNFREEERSKVPSTVSGHVLFGCTQ